MRPVVPDDELVGRVLGEKLLVDQRIGAGAIGVVYRAKHLHLLQPVAVKVLHGNLQRNTVFRQRFLAEARSAHTLDHPNVVRVIDFGEERDGTLWLAMELLDGVELEHEIGSMTIGRAVELTLQVCAALAHAHARGIVHGDVKPSNVLIVKRFDDDGEESERVKLCDFGSPIDAHLGTPHYMSPEQCLGEPLDARSDVYSCGVLFYELVVGEPPFDADDADSVLRQQIIVPPILPSRKRPGLDRRIDAFVMKALAKDKADRFASMREMRAALRELLVDLGPRARHISEIRPIEGVPGAAESSPDPVGEFLAAHSIITSGEKRTLAALLASGNVEASAAHAARLLARIEATNGNDNSAVDAITLLDDPKALTPIADRLLSEDIVPGPYLDRVLRHAGLAAARALWSARISQRPSHERRARFVTWLGATGEECRAMLLLALSRLSPEGGVQMHPELAEDVLLAIPQGADQALAIAVKPFTISPAPRVRDLARAAVDRLTPRARGA